MGKRQTRDTSAKSKNEARYGVFLNVHHRKDEKHVTLHKLPCDDYTENSLTAAYGDAYTLHTAHSRFDKAIKDASKLSLNWHANIRACKECWDK